MFMTVILLRSAWHFFVGNFYKKLANIDLILALNLKYRHRFDVTCKKRAIFSHSINFTGPLYSYLCCFSVVLLLDQKL